MKVLLKFFSFTILIIVLISNVNYSQWVQIALPNVKVNCLTPNNNAPNSTTTILFAGTDISGIYSSTDNGDMWQRKDNGIVTSSVNAINTQSANYLAGTNNGLFISQDNGNNWSVPSINGLTDSHINAICFDAFSNAYLGTNSGVFIAANNSPDFSAKNSGLTNTSVNCFGIYLANNTEYLYCGTKAGLFVTTNQAQSWNALQVGTNSINSISTNAMRFFTSDAGLYFMRFQDTSPQFTVGGLSDVNLLSLCITNIIGITSADIFAGTGTSGKVYYSKYWGNSWVPVSAGLLSNNRVNCLAVFGSYLIAGTDNGIWRRTLVSLTSVEDQNNSIPSHYNLEQNYPNPFNPISKIKYDLPRNDFVTLKVYDAIGKELVTLVNSQQTAGHHEINFDGSNLSSGIYFYRIQTGNFMQTKKMILLK